MQELQQLSKEIWEHNYKLGNENSVTDLWNRLAINCAEVEEEKIKHKVRDKFYNILEDFKFVPGGRNMANLGTNRRSTTLMNCFVHSPKDINYRDPDSIEGIYEMLKAQAHTLKSEGGYGMNFSWIRPKGTYIEGIDARTPGAIKFMELWDKSSEIITMGSDMKVGKNRKNEKKKIRKGAMMGVLSCWHPEIEDFIKAKQVPHRLTKFNMSVGVFSDFMDRVINDQTWDLRFPDTTFEHYNNEWDGDIYEWEAKSYPIKIYNTIQARELWELLMYSTYTRNEPGVLFFDIINKYNPLSYAEFVQTSNPCLTGDTLIAVADGRNAVSIKQLFDENNPVDVYTIDNGKVTIGTSIKIMKTGTKAVLKIILDDDSSFKVTPDHKIMLRNGKYIQAKNLTSGDSLMPFNSYISNKNYRQISSNIGRDRRQYRLIAEYNGLIVDPKNTAIHHKNFDSFNDCIENLESMPHLEHRKLHSEKMLGAKNPYHKMSDEWKYNFASHPGETNSNYSGVSNANIIENAIELTKNLNRQFTRNEWVEFAKEENLPQSFSKFRQKEFGTLFEFSKMIANKIKIPVMEKYELRSYILKHNHTVISIEKCDIEDVYDMIVPDTNNFGIITSSKDKQYIISSGIFVHNCGEIPMSAGVCNIGSLNLTQFVEYGNFNFEDFKETVRWAVRFLDNINDISGAPLPEYKESMVTKRRIGLGTMGLGSLHFMLGIRYGSPESLNLIDDIFKIKTETEILESARLGKEKGSFKQFDREEYFSTYWWNTLPISDKIKRQVEEIGEMRNSHRSMNAPTGNTSTFANLISGGIEPVFMKEYIRWMIVPENDRATLKNKGLIFPDIQSGEWYETIHFEFDTRGDEQILKGSFEGIDYEIDKNRGLIKSALVEDYGWKYVKDNIPYNEMKSLHESGIYATTEELTVEEHLNVLRTISKYIDQNSSKTVNLPNEYSYEKFKELYLNAWHSNIKGLTTYRAGTMAVVLEKKKEIQKYQTELDELFAKSNGDILVDIEIKLPGEYHSKGYIIRDKNKKKWYLHIAFADSKYQKPFAIFVNTNNKETTEVADMFILKIEQLCRDKGIREDLITLQREKYSGQTNVTKIARAIGLALRHNIAILDIVEVLDDFDLELSTFIYHLKKFLSRFIKDGTKIKGEICPQCNEASIVFQEGCRSCKQCGYSVC